MSKEKAAKIYKFLKDGHISFEGGHDVYTPQPLVEEILGKIPLDGEILVLFNVEFVISLLYTFCIDASKITFYSDHPNKTILLQKLGVTKYLDTLDDDDMKFDVVIGNPPYQAPGKENKAKLWPQFIELSFNNLTTTQSIIALITPKRWLLNGQWERHFAPHRILCINIDECRKHFPLAHSSFSYFVVQRAAPTTNSIVVVPSGTRTQDLTNVTGDALYYTGILGKMIIGTEKFPMITSSGYNTSGFSQNKKSLSRVKTESHPHFIVHKISHKTGEISGFWSSHLDNTTYGVPRVVSGLWLSDWKKDRLQVSTELLTCEQFRHFPTNTIQEAHVLKEVLTSKLYTFLLYSLCDGNSQKNKASGSITNYAVSLFPKIDLTRSWTDQELYAHFNLTQEEINIVEATVR